MRSTHSLEVPLVVVVDQRGERAIGDEHDVAAMTTIASIRTALRHVRLATERRAARAAVTGLHEYLHFIDEHAAPTSSGGSIVARR